MKRLILSDVITDADGRRPNVPAATSGYVVLADFPQRNRMLVKVNIPDGTAQTANTIADITTTTDADGRVVQVDVNAQALSGAQKTAVKTALTNAGFTAQDFDTFVTNRARLAWFVLRRYAGWQQEDLRLLFDGFDAA